MAQSFRQKYSPGAEGDFSQETKLKTEEPFDMASQQRMIQLLKTVREPIAEFQERRGISKQEYVNNKIMIFPK